MKPVHVFSFTWVLFIILGLISFIFPKEGIKINDDLSLDYPRILSLFELDTTVQKDFSSILVEDFDIDSIDLEALEKQQRMDSAVEAHIRDSIRRWQLKLHYPDNNKSVLHPFFEALESAMSMDQPVRIMHYGDSQIEGDRISGYLRYKLQAKFGGSGPGLVPAVPLVRSAAFDLESSDNWKRYTMYGKVDSLVTHNRYGPLATFGRFTPIIADSIDIRTVIGDSVKSAFLTYKKSKLTYANTRKFSTYEIQFGNFRLPVQVSVSIDDSLLQQQSFLPSEEAQSLKGNLDESPDAITFSFVGHDSPDVYSVNLQGHKGVVVDNIALRGSAGTLFRKMERGFLAESLKNLNTRLLVLQFGGNVMPYMDTEKEAENYGKWFESQMRLLKQIIPNVSIIVIGPSDMGVFENNTYTSYPLLTKVRDELKAATFRQGGAYWDMMEAMGGLNSMHAWVNAKPALASKDYVHFNLKGASKIAQMFYNALIEDYNAYKNQTE